MALLESQQFGTSYKWGFKSSDSPTIDSNFTCRGADLKVAPEVDNKATDGEGHAESRTQSIPGYRKIMGSFTGYINANFNPLGVAASFSWAVPGAGTRFFVITNIGEPIKKGDYVEVTIDAESDAGVGSAVPGGGG